MNETESASGQKLAGVFAVWLIVFGGLFAAVNGALFVGFTLVSAADSTIVLPAVPYVFTFVALILSPVMITWGVWSFLNRTKGHHDEYSNA